MKKLLQINPVIKENTSTGKIMRELGDLAMAEGWDSYIAYSRARDGVPKHASKLLPVGNWVDLCIHWIATRVFDAHGLASSIATKRLIRQIRQIDPDIIHIHNVHGYFLNYPLLCRFLAERGKPVIWTVHDCWLFTGHCYHYAAAGCLRWQEGCHHCPQKRAFPASYLLDRSERNYRVKRQALTAVPGLSLVVVSQWMKGEISHSFLKDVPCRVIYNGIDLDMFQPRLSPSAREEYGIIKPVYYLAVASIWLPEKGVSDLVSLAAQLHEDEQLVMVGQIPEDLLRTLPPHVVTIPRTSNAKALSLLYSQATALLNPTWQDNYPTVNLEAIACGTPVITYKTGGSVESITPETGFVVEQGDIGAMRNAMDEIRGQDRDKLRGACRAFALAHFDRKACFGEYIKLYEELSSGQGIAYSGGNE